ncbi:hypothetical protein H5407_14955 [Mitsuaria sp. WAJ17]|uniref:hypothetical protein n=1 Tax=Mitsuaria sp. WAJ17 TaxID=2761452 RepID=UPI0016008F9C|nr:hypothetical protein [Mitsuaria sp. WAJ17]MBB2486523.1 hypothetical protein [Mitsuaria sp. WAJ17]
MRSTPTEGAREALPAALINPNPEAQWLLAQARNAAFAEASRGRLGQGLALLAGALEQEPLSHELLSDMAALLLSAGELLHAVRYAREALVITPHHGASLYTLGFALAGLGEEAAALEVLTQLLTGQGLISLEREAPELVGLVRAELARLQTRANEASAASSQG